MDVSIGEFMLPIASDKTMNKKYYFAVRGGRPAETNLKARTHKYYWQV